MTIYLKTIGLVVLCTLLSYCIDKKITCVINGKVIGRDSDTLVLLKATESDILSQNKILIPIKDSIFKYTLIIPKIEVYQLIFMDELKRGAWIPTFFFAENTAIQLTLYPMNHARRNMVSGGDLNRDYTNYRTLYNRIFGPLFDSIQVLVKRNEDYTEDYKAIKKLILNETDSIKLLDLSKKLNELPQNGMSQKAIILDNKFDSSRKAFLHWKYKYIEQNPSLLTYYLILEDMKKLKNSDTNIEIITDIKRASSLFVKKYPDHPYTQILREKLYFFEKLRVGGSYIDFEAPDLNGNLVRLSEVIKNKFALIDLWASWCGPCLKNSRSMIPIYMEFNDKGFTICGIASEINNTVQLKNRLDKEKFPWINLVELDSQNNIWTKYDLGQHTGGKTFLVDRDGKILAIDPTAEEVRNILTKELK
jgi:peroxiredoxin